MSNCVLGRLEEKFFAELAVTSAPVSIFVRTGVPTKNVFSVHADDVA